MIHYTFRSGALSCNAGSPTVHLEADVRVLPATAGVVIGHDGADIIIAGGSDTWRVIGDHGDGRLGRVQFEQI